MNRLRAAIALLVAVAGGCTSETIQLRPDAGAPDASVPDATPFRGPDAAIPDAAIPDVR